MRLRIRRSQSWLPLLLLGLGLTASVAAQRLPKPEFNRNPTVLLAPAWLSATTPNIIPSSYLRLDFGSVANAVEYRVSRSADGGPEVVIHQGPIRDFVYRGNDCTPGAPIPHPPIPNEICTYLDWNNITSFVTYTYWVRAVYPYDVVGPPSRPATATSR